MFEHKLLRAISNEAETKIRYVMPSEESQDAVYDTSLDPTQHVDKGLEARLCALKLPSNPGTCHAADSQGEAPSHPQARAGVRTPRHIVELRAWVSALRPGSGVRLYGPRFEVLQQAKIICPDVRGPYL